MATEATAWTARKIGWYELNSPYGLFRYPPKHAPGAQEKQPAQIHDQEGSQGIKKGSYTLACIHQFPATREALGEAWSEGTETVPRQAVRDWVEESIPEKTSLKALQYLLKNSPYFWRFLFFKSLKGALVHPS